MELNAPVVNMTRIKAIKLKSTEIGAPKKFVAKNIERYQLFQSTNQKGESYEEDRIYFEYDNLPHFVSLNNKSLIWLAKHGVDVSLNGLEGGALNGANIHFVLVDDQGAWPFYMPEKLVLKK